LQLFTGANGIEFVTESTFPVLGLYTQCRVFRI
jgi:hypothetical protein